MKKFVIEREIPKVGNLAGTELRDAAKKSNHVLEQLGPEIQWQESFITADKMFCVYLAADESLIRKHAELSGFPATTIREVGNIIDPTTAVG
jgi:Nickel responsive protein SCO4226-like